MGIEFAFRETLFTSRIVESSPSSLTSIILKLDYQCLAYGHFQINK